MCLGLPMRVLAAGEGSALCEDAAGRRQYVDTLLVADAAPGEWLMVFLGAARERIDVVRAREVGLAVEAIGRLLAGEAVDLDAAFADLASREPRLPDFLQERVR